MISDVNRVRPGSVSVWVTAPPLTQGRALPSLIRLVRGATHRTGYPV
jgi:hypothetical protein